MFLLENNEDTHEQMIHQVAMTSVKEGRQQIRKECMASTSRCVEKGQRREWIAPEQNTLYQVGWDDAFESQAW